MAQYRKPESTMGSIGSIILAILEVQEERYKAAGLWLRDGSMGSFRALAVQMAQNGERHRCLVGCG